MNARLSPLIETRDVPPRAAHALEQSGVPKVLARVLAARGIRNADELDDDLARLHPPHTLLNAHAAGQRLADAIERRERIVVVADYDCDGATACVVALRGLRLLGAEPSTLTYVVPDRRLHGYGLTATVVDLCKPHEPQLLVTVDNGIASFEGIAHARGLGIDVLVTDHHLPARPNGEDTLPGDCLIVNPNQPGCGFASKHLAGVGVMFYVLLSARAVLRERGRWGSDTQPRLDALLDLVALGTVADVVRLDANNRRLVAQGLRRMRARRMQPGVAALFTVAAREPSRASTSDLGFALGPRLNAAGRLSDMSLGIECLLSDDPERALMLATQLDAINRERRHVETDMRDHAERLLSRWTTQGESLPVALTLFDASFHEGVVGLVAGRVKDALHRPAFVFARASDGSLKGSGRSIAGVHLRDALDWVSKRHPTLLSRFGGHAAAAGCTLRDGEATTLAQFDAALCEAVQSTLDDAVLTRRLRTDGPLAADEVNVQTAMALDAQVWGQAFEAPVFFDEVEVLQQRIVGERHLKLRVRHRGVERDAICFARQEPVAPRLRMAFRLALDEYQGRQRVQLIVEAVAEVTASAEASGLPTPP